MKSKLLSHLLCWFALSACAQPSNDKTNMIDRLKIQYVDLSIMTAIRVDCSEFESYFNKSISKQEITSKEFLSSFSEQLSNLKVISEDYNPNPDTRIRLEIISNDNIELVCIGNLVVKYKGESYVNDESFKQLIQSQLE